MQRRVGPDVFAILIPLDRLTHGLFAHPRNARRFVRRDGRSSTPDPTVTAPASPTAATPAGNMDDDCQPVDPALFDKIVLSFKVPPKDPNKGWVLGSDPNKADVLLDLDVVSSSHVRIFVTEDGRIWLKGYCINGTAVSYDFKHAAKRQNDMWILANEPGQEPRYWNNIIVRLGTDVRFRIIFPQHKDPSPQYKESLQHLWDATAAASTDITTLRAINLEQRPYTVPQTEAVTPRFIAQPLFQDLTVITQTKFAKVSRVVNTRDGRVYLAKQIRGRKFGCCTPQQILNAVREQVDIMRAPGAQNTIVPLLDFVADPMPSLIMPEYTHGTLAERIDPTFNPQPMSRHDRHSLLRQILVALQAIHRIPAVHRDLRPANIFITSKPDNPLEIVLTDFELAVKADHVWLMPMVGPPREYDAPDMWLQQPYGPPTDIWSAGMVLLQVIRPLFRWSPGTVDDNFAWHQRILNVVNGIIDDPATRQEGLLLREMLVWEPGRRRTADECLRSGRATGLWAMTADGWYIDTAVAVADDLLRIDAAVLNEVHGPAQLEAATPRASPVVQVVDAIPLQLGDATHQLGSTDDDNIHLQLDDTAHQMGDTYNEEMYVSTPTRIDHVPGAFESGIATPRATVAQVSDCKPFHDDAPPVPRIDATSGNVPENAFMEDMYAYYTPDGVQSEHGESGAAFADAFYTPASQHNEDGSLGGAFVDGTYANNMPAVPENVVDNPGGSITQGTYQYTTPASQQGEDGDPSGAFVPGTYQYTTPASQQGEDGNPGGAFVQGTYQYNTPAGLWSEGGTPTQSAYDASFPDFRPELRATVGVLSPDEGAYVYAPPHASPFPGGLNAVTSGQAGIDPHTPADREVTPHKALPRRPEYHGPPTTSRASAMSPLKRHAERVSARAFAADEPYPTIEESPSPGPSNWMALAYGEGEISERSRKRIALSPRA